MTPFNPHTAASLAAALEEADRKATPAPYGVIEEPQGRGRCSFRVNDANGMWVAEFDDAEHDAHAHATLRNHASAAAAQLRAAIVEVERLGSAIDHTVAARNKVEDLLVEDRDSALADVARLTEENERLRGALSKINDIRDSIVGMQGFNFSEHAYPLVAVLDAAGFKGKGYEIARANLGTLIEQAKKAEADRDALKVENERLAAKVEGHIYNAKIHMQSFYDMEKQYSSLSARLAAAEAECERMRAVHGFDEWHEDVGPALWWMLPVCEPPYCGTPLDDDWPFDDDERPAWTTLAVPPDTTPPENKP